MILFVIAFALGTTTAVDLKPCNLDTPSLGRTEAKCGEVVVDDGAHIGFAIVEADSAGSNKEPDPIVLLPGGPGQAGTDLAGFAALEVGNATRHRDLVLFDPRGTGRSGALRCDDKRPLEVKLAASDEEERARLQACAAKIGGGVAPASITTERIAKDLDAVRAALGVTSWNMLGISYGTRVALAYDRMFPGKARSLILDSVVPFSMIVGQSAAQDAEASLAALEKRCAGCTKRPFLDIVRSLSTMEKREVTLAHPKTGKHVRLTLDGRAVVGVVRLLLYSDATSAILPALLAAADDGDLTPLAAQIYLAEQESDTISEGMQLAVLCAEDVPFLVEDAKEDASPFHGFREQMKAACDAWPHATVPKSFHEDLPASTTPALLISGGADPVTPPPTAKTALKTLPRGRAVVVAGMGHNPGLQGCLPANIARFIANASSSSPAGGAPPGDDDDELATCAKRSGPFPAFVDAMGPRP